MNVYEKICKEEVSLDRFSMGYKHFGFTINDANCITYREWAPNVQAAYLLGDFSILSVIHTYY